MKKPGVELESCILVFLLREELKTVPPKPKLLTKVGNPIQCDFSGGQLYECSCAIAEYLVMILSSLCAFFYWHCVKVCTFCERSEVYSTCCIPHSTRRYPVIMVLHPSEMVFCFRNTLLFCFFWKAEVIRWFVERPLNRAFAAKYTDSS